MQSLQLILGLPKHKCRHWCQHFRLSVLTWMVALCVGRTSAGDECAARGPNANGTLRTTKQKR